ncbi:MAG: aldehyde dehydrogenase [Chitinophagales bacterium]|nr:aldehyde dehydrogenase [Chitinophagales bacterium]
MTLVPAPPAANNAASNNMGSILQKQRDFFASNVTKDVNFRINQLKRLKHAIQHHEKEVFEALKLDLNKHPFEAFGTEIGIVLNEIDNCINNLPKWSKPQKVSTPLFYFKADSFIQPEPYGLTLVIAPWNYPFQLLMVPVVGAIAAGNCVVAKPSEVAEHTSAIVTKILKEAFHDNFVSVFEGDASMSQELLTHKFDYIFYTGSTAVGKIVYQAAAKHLTPVTLELGGKSPCIVDSNMDIELAAKRIMWGKLINAGQTCVAPDYLLVNESIKPQLIAAIKKQLLAFYGKDTQKSPYLCRIINQKHFNRLQHLVNTTTGTVVEGGEFVADKRYISPTIIDNVSTDDAIMQEEIFGPILPILGYKNINDAISYIKANPKPLALYIFSRSSELQNQILSEVSAGGVCINDTLMHFGNDKLPFGGVGDSGIGHYHGERTFDTFSHKKAVMNRSLLIDAPFYYPPYRIKIPLLKQLMKRFG